MGSAGFIDEVEHISGEERVKNNGEDFLLWQPELKAYSG
jgi:hypothetical protein